MGFRFSSKKGSFPFFFQFCLRKISPVGVLWWDFFLFFMWTQDPALHCLQRAAHWDQWLTGTLTGILAHSSATIVSHISSCSICFGWLFPRTGLCVVPPRNDTRTDFQSKSLKGLLHREIKKITAHSCPSAVCFPLPVKSGVGYHWHHKLRVSL